MRRHRDTVSDTEAKCVLFVLYFFAVLAVYLFAKHLHRRVVQPQPAPPAIGTQR